MDSAKSVYGSRTLAWARKIPVAGIRWHGSSASAVVIYGGRRLQLDFSLIQRRWRIATRLVFTTLFVCDERVPAKECTRGSRVAVLWFVSPPIFGLPSIPVPEQVQRAGGQEVRDFEAGARILTSSGCLACHRIGDVGNGGPGPVLTHVGSRVQRAQIERVLRNPSAPMPSFKNMPKDKFSELVRFLQLLR